MKKNSVVTALGMITQFGLCVITPILLCIFGSMWLKNRFALGDWVVLAGLLFGVGSSVLSMIKTIDQMGQIMKEDDDER